MRGAFIMQLHLILGPTLNFEFWRHRRSRSVQPLGSSPPGIREVIAVSAPHATKCQESSSSIKYLCYVIPTSISSAYHRITTRFCGACHPAAPVHPCNNLTLLWWHFPTIIWCNYHGRFVDRAVKCFVVVVPIVCAYIPAAVCLVL
jgi:hypothetical protein